MTAAKDEEERAHRAPMSVTHLQLVEPLPKLRRLLQREEFYDFRCLERLRDGSLCGELHGPQTVDECYVASLCVSTKRRPPSIRWGRIQRLVA